MKDYQVTCYFGDFRPCQFVIRAKNWKEANREGKILCRERALVAHSKGFFFVNTRKIKDE